MTSHPRGFTLMEMMVSLLVAAVVVAGALTLLIGQQRTFVASSGDRAAQEAGRVALERLSAELRHAGYGMDPAMAFDFGAAASPMDRADLPAGVGTVPFGGYACDAAVTCRDHTDAPDEIVFHFRDPNFGRTVLTDVKAPTASSLQLAGPLNSPLLPGQILQVMCYDAQRWAYVTVGKRVDASKDPSIDVTLEDPSGGGTDFPWQNQFLLDPCFASKNVSAFKIHRSRYFIETYLPDGRLVPWGTADGRPYLMLDEGLRDDAGLVVKTVVAPDVEDLQFAYVFPLSPPASQVRGATAGVALKNDAAGIDLAPGTIPSIPTYATASRDVPRTTGHPSNIRSVRVAVVVRQPEADRAIVDPTLPALLNRDAIQREVNRRRTVFQTSVTIPNMTSRAPSFPSYGQPGVAADEPLNHGGG